MVGFIDMVPLAILDHERFAEPLFQFLSHRARNQIRAASRRERHHDGDATARIILCRSGPWSRGEKSKAHEGTIEYLAHFTFSLSSSARNRQRLDASM
jgi:hypothetical protein